MLEEIKTKKELIEELGKTKASELDKFIEFKVRENVLRELLKDREEDNKYFFEKLDSVDKRLGVIEFDIKKKNVEIERLKKDRDDWRRIARKKEK